MLGRTRLDPRVEQGLLALSTSSVVRWPTGFLAHAFERDFGTLSPP